MTIFGLCMEVLLTIKVSKWSGCTDDGQEFCESHVMSFHVVKVEHARRDSQSVKFTES